MIAKSAFFTAMGILALIAMPGCNSESSGPEQVPCDPPSKPGVFEVGTGEDCFARLSDGAEIPLQNGPQGGYHLFVAVGCKDCGETVRIQYGVRDPMTNAALTGTYENKEMMALTGDTWRQVAGIQLSMPGTSWDEQNDPPPAKGTALILWANALDANDKLIHEAQVSLVIGNTEQWDPCDPGDESEACAGNGI